MKKHTFIRKPYTPGKLAGKDGGKCAFCNKRLRQGERIDVVMGGEVQETGPMIKGKFISNRIMGAHRKGDKRCKVK